MPASPNQDDEANNEQEEKGGAGQRGFFSLANALSMVRKKQDELKIAREEKEKALEEEKKEKARDKRRRRRKNQKVNKAKLKAQTQLQAQESAEQSEKCDKDCEDDDNVISEKVEVRSKKVKRSRDLFDETGEALSKNYKASLKFLPRSVMIKNRKQEKKTATG